MLFSGNASDLPVVYADDAILVLHKPAGLLCVPGRGPDKQDCLSARAQARWGDARTVHRLDQATSGLVVMARGLAHQRQLSRAFELRQVFKRYSAVVQGCVPPDWCDWQTITEPIAVDWPNRPLRKIDPVGGKAATTRVRVARGSQRGAPADATHLELEPLTGRTHQLRLHLAASGFPILGDALYAPTEVAIRTPRLMLHACELAFQHPASGASMRWQLDPLKYTGEPQPERRSALPFDSL